MHLRQGLREERQQWRLGGYFTDALAGFGGQLGIGGELRRQVFEYGAGASLRAHAVRMVWVVDKIELLGK